MVTSSRAYRPFSTKHACGIVRALCLNQLCYTSSFHFTLTAGVLTSADGLPSNDPSTCSCY